MPNDKSLENNVQIVGNLFLSHPVSAKSKKPYYALCIDLGYAVRYLTFDINLIGELLGVALRDLESICPVDASVPVCLSPLV